MFNTNYNHTSWLDITKGMWFWKYKKKNSKYHSNQIFPYYWQVNLSRLWFKQYEQNVISIRKRKVFFSSSYINRRKVTLVSLSNWLILSQVYSLKTLISKDLLNLHISDGCLLCSFLHHDLVWFKFLLEVGIWIFGILRWHLLFRHRLKATAHQCQQLSHWWLFACESYSASHPTWLVWNEKCI